MRALYRFLKFLEDLYKFSMMYGIMGTLISLSLLGLVIWLYWKRHVEEKQKAAKTPKEDDWFEPLP